MRAPSPADGGAEAGSDGACATMLRVADSIVEDDEAPSVSGRILRLLSAFTMQESTLSLTELARRADLPKSTAHRLAAELVKLGLLERADGQLRLGLKLFELGQLVPTSRVLRDIALPVLEDLQQATNQTVHFAVRDGVDIVYLEILHPPREQHLPSRIGGRLPAYCTGVGKALLAYAGDDVVHQVVQAGMPRRTPHTICMPGRLTGELKRIRDQGYAYDRQEAIDGIVCVAAPVLGADGAVAAALSVTGHAGRLNLNRLAPSIRMAGMTLSRRLRAVDALV